MGEIMNDAVCTKTNKIIFLNYIVAILPTLIFGLLGNVEDHKTLIWIWDVLTIGLFFLINMFYVKKIDKKAIILGIIFMFIMAIQFIVYSSSLTNGFVEKLYMVLPVVYFVHFLSVYCFLSNKKSNEFDATKFFNYFLIFVMLACIYNIIKNFSLLFSLSNISNKYINISSFFTQRNAFGQLLFLGTIANVFLLIKTKNKKYIITLLIILLNLLFSFSRTAIFSTIIFLFIVYYKKYMNLKYKKNIIILFFVIIAAFLLLLIFKNDSLKNFLEYYVLRKEDGLTGRSTIWEACIKKLSGFRIFYGYGLGSSNKIMSYYNLSNSHNTIIEILLSGGLALLSFYVIIYGIVLNAIKKIKNSDVRIVLIAFYISFIVYSLFEKIMIFGTGYASVIFTLFFIAIPLLYKNNE